MSLFVTLKKGEPLEIMHNGEKLIISVPEIRSSCKIRIDGDKTFKVARENWNKKKQVPNNDICSK